MEPRCTNEEIRNLFASITLEEQSQALAFVQQMRLQPENGANEAAV